MVIRRATINDYDDYYQIKADTQNVIWGGFSAPPQYEGFKNIFLSRINAEDRREYVCELDNAIVGFLAAVEDDDNVEISYGVLEQATGKGVASALISFVIHEYKNKNVIAWVSELNYGSEKCLLKNGFEKLNDSEYRYLALKGVEHKFNKWVKKSVSSPQPGPNTAF